MGVAVVSDWQEIKTAPKDGSLFLAYNETMRIYEVVGWWKRKRCWSDNGAGPGLTHKCWNKNYFSHWMHFPAPPIAYKITIK